MLVSDCSFGGFDKTSGRSRRSLYSFAKIVWHYTGIDSVNFNGHGNYCGVGGEGTIQDPLDLFDFQTGKIVGAHLAEESVTETSKIVGGSRGTVSKVMTVYTVEGKTSSAKHRRGRNSKLDEMNSRVLKRMVKFNKKTTAAKITLELNGHLQRPASTKSIKRELCTQNIYGVARIMMNAGIRSRVLIVLLVILHFSFASEEIALARRKRSLFNFARMVLSMTGTNSVRFNGHGNYCGSGGSGNVTDPLDLCCKHHDDCWQKVREEYCLMSAYITYYSWEKQNGTITCNFSYASKEISLGRRKRSLFNFAKMVMSVTGTNSVHYNGHGNYCGVGGSGNITDPLDLCCKHHDDCWGKVTEEYCLMSAYITFYSWEKQNGTITCTVLKHANREFAKPVTFHFDADLVRLLKFLGGNAKKNVKDETVITHNFSSFDFNGGDPGRKGDDHDECSIICAEVSNIKYPEIIEITDDDSFESTSSSVTPCNEKPEEFSESDILKGIKAFVEVYSGFENRSNGCARVLRRLGADVLPKFTKEVTHLIFKNGRSKIFRKAILNKVKIVSVLWLERCKMRKARIPEDPFSVKDCMPRTMEKKPRSMHPKNFNKHFSSSEKKIKVILGSADFKQNTETPPRIKLLKKTLFAKEREDAKDTNGKENSLIKSQLSYSEPTKKMNSLSTFSSPSNSVKYYHRPSSLLAENKNTEENSCNVSPQCFGRFPLLATESTTKHCSNTILETAVSKNIKDDFKPGKSKISSKGSNAIKKASLSTNERTENFLKYRNPKNPGKIIRNKKEERMENAAFFKLFQAKAKEKNVHLKTCTRNEDYKQCNCCQEIWNYGLKKANKLNSSACNVDQDINVMIKSILPFITCTKKSFNQDVSSTPKLEREIEMDCLTQSLKKLSPVNERSPSNCCTDLFMVDDRKEIQTMTQRLTEHSSNKNNCSPPNCHRETEMDSITESFKNLSPANKPLPSNCSFKVEERKEIPTLTQRLNEYSSNKNTSLIREIKEVPTFKKRFDTEVYNKLIENSKVLDEANISGIALILPDDLMSDCDYALSEREKQKQSRGKLIHEAEEYKYCLPNIQNSKSSVIDYVDQSNQLVLETPNQKLNNILKPRESVAEFKKHYHLQHTSKKPMKHRHDEICIYILESNIRSKDTRILQEAMKKLGGGILKRKDSDRATHVVCGDDLVSYNVVKGIISGCWIMSFEWVGHFNLINALLIKQSLQENKWIEEEKFELYQCFPAAKISRLNKQNSQGLYLPDIFSSIGPIFINTHSSKLTKDLQSIVLKCQGLVTGAYKTAKLSIGRYFKEIPSVNVQWILESSSTRVGQKILVLTQKTSQEKFVLALFFNKSPLISMHLVHQFSSFAITLQKKVIDPPDTPQQHGWLHHHFENANSIAQHKPVLFSDYSLSLSV
ncbi:Microcephalin [Nymphon striatum]|nr:Microcephalin [Nymphon striatum]